MLSIMPPAEIEERLDAVGKSTDCSKASFVREAIVERLSELEELQVAEQRLRNNEAGRSRTDTLEEVEHELGLADRVRQRCSEGSAQARHCNKSPHHQISS